MTLLCFCNPTNKDFQQFYLLPSVTHLLISSLLQENDERLKSGVKLKRLSELRRTFNGRIA
jgi:hypothetical protein